MSEVYDLLNKENSMPKLNLIGKAFYGKKNVSKKDGSYITTLWLSFCYLPIIPYDTYRIINPKPSILPIVYRLDEFLYFQSVRKPFEWSQVVSTIVITWGSFLALFFINVFVGYKFGSIWGWGTFAAIAVFFLLLIWVNYIIYIRPKKEHTKEIKQKDKEPVKQIKSVIENPVVLETKQTSAYVKPAQVKFDPNKILEWHSSSERHANLDELEIEGSLGVAGWLGVLNLALLVLQIFLEIFFRMAEGQIESLNNIHGFLQILRDYKILAVSGTALFIATIRTLPLIAIILLILSVSVFLQLQDYLIEFMIQ